MDYKGINVLKDIANENRIESLEWCRCADVQIINTKGGCMGELAGKTLLKIERYEGAYDISMASLRRMCRTRKLETARKVNGFWYVSRDEMYNLLGQPKQGVLE